jgi:hypothetical protein
MDDESNPSRDKDLVITARVAVEPTQPFIQWVLNRVHLGKAIGVMLTTHPHLAETLRMCGAFPPYLLTSS